jgi:hypothetical protein
MEMLLARLYVRGDILLTRDLHDSIISLRGEVWAYQTSLATPLFIEVPVPSQESGWSCMFVLEVSTLSLSTILILDFAIDPTVWYFHITTDTLFTSI